MATTKHIGSLSEYLQPPKRKLTADEISDVSIDLAQRIRAVALAMTPGCGEPVSEINQTDLMTLLYSLHNDACVLCGLLENKGAEQS